MFPELCYSMAGRELVCAHDLPVSSHMVGCSNLVPSKPFLGRLEESSTGSCHCPNLFAYLGWKAAKGMKRSGLGFGALNNFVYRHC